MEFFKNKDGKVVIWQAPNLLLWSWIATTGLGYLLRGSQLHDGVRSLGSAVLFAWAYLEIQSGESPFRRVLGLLVIGMVVVGFFR